MKTNSKIGRFKRTTSVSAGLFLGLVAGLLAPADVRADGCFVASPFVWNKHKDINEPTQKAIIFYDGGREDLILQVKYDGPVEEFGWLIPVPGLPTVQKGSMDCFYELSRYTQEHFEQPGRRHRGFETLGDSEAQKPQPVKVIELKTVGAYEVAVLSTKDAGALADWLKANGFAFPDGKAGVLDAYVKRHWYFVASKIHIGRGDDFRLVTGTVRPIPGVVAGVQEKLAQGELHPLQISFASDRCVYPLGISSINGTPSEVQVYVLSPEPLVEKVMFEKKLPEVHQRRIENEARREQAYTKLLALRRNLRGADVDPPERPDYKLSRREEVNQADLLPYGWVTNNELAVCSKKIPRLGVKSCWLTKQTWTFKPGEMRDLEFQPAIPVFVDKLADEEGYFVAANLAQLGSNAAAALLKALRSTNPAVRVHAASVAEQIKDPGMAEDIAGLFKDPEPEVRMHAAYAASAYWKPAFAEPLTGLLQDGEAEVRSAATYALQGHRDDAAQYLPVFQKMLHDDNPDVQASGLRMLISLQVKISREDLLRLCNTPRQEVVGMAASLLRRETVSCEEAVPLLHNPVVLARMVGLRILWENGEKRSIELAIPLLSDPSKTVQDRAAATLRALTGQHLPADQPAEWEKWWAATNATFQVERHPEELRPQPPFRNSPAAP